MKKTGFEPAVEIGQHAGKEQEKEHGEAAVDQRHTPAAPFGPLHDHPQNGGEDRRERQDAEATGDHLAGDRSRGDPAESRQQEDVEWIGVTERTLLSPVVVERSVAHEIVGVMKGDVGVVDEEVGREGVERQRHGERDQDREQPACGHPRSPFAPGSARSSSSRTSTMRRNQKAWRKWKTKPVLPSRMPNRKK